MLGRIVISAAALAIAGASFVAERRPAANAPAAEPLGRHSYDLSEGEDTALSAMAVTELKADSRGHYVTRAEINGATIAVLVDTGATQVALSFEDASDAGLKPRSLDYDVPVATANGVVKAAAVSLRRVEVDGVAVRDVEGLVLPEGAMRGTLLGMSFLGRLSSFRFEDGVLILRD